MSFPNRPKASSNFALLCDDDGRIIRDFGDPLTAGSPVGLTESVGFAHFLEAVRDRGAVVGWETEIRSGESTSSLLLHGAQTPCGVLVFAISNPGLRALDHAGPAVSATVAEHRDAGAEDAAELMFAAVHELKNPISSIISSCEYLSEYSRESLDSEQMAMIERMHSSAMTLLQVSGKIAEFSKAKLRSATKRRPQRKTAQE